MLEVHLSPCSIILTKLAQQPIIIVNNEYFNYSLYAIQNLEIYNSALLMQPILCCVCKSSLHYRYSNEVLAIQLAVKTTLCGQAFQEKINDVVFAGFPLALETSDVIPRRTPGTQNTTMVSFHVVFALPVGMNGVCVINKQAKNIGSMLIT